MILQKKTLQKLRTLINEETEYRTGPQLVAFFNELGFNDQYRQGFPSRWIYTDEKLAKINGTPEIDKCIKMLFAPINFINRYAELDSLINQFNQFLAFDGWQVKRDEQEITFTKAGKINFSPTPTPAAISEDDFLKNEFNEIPVAKLNLDGTIADVINIRLGEIKKCLTVKAPLSVIFMCGSTLEGIMLGIALSQPKEFNRALSAPKDKEQKVKAFQDWSLSNFIDVSHELQLIKEDVKKFSHSLRQFRNYIHPYEQLSSRFEPDEHTAKICWQVLKAAIYQISSKT